MRPNTTRAVPILFILISGCSSIAFASESALIVGVWSGPPRGLVEVRKEGELFQLIQVSQRLHAGTPGALIAEFTFDEKSGVYTGRHKWNSGQGGQDRWGRDGGVRIERIADDQFLMAYLDSKYTGGWTFSRVVPSRETVPDAEPGYARCEYAEVVRHEAVSCNARPDLALIARSQEEPLYFMDLNRISDIAIRAAHEKYPDIPKYELIAVDHVSAFCYRSSLLQDIPHDQQRIGECKAQISVHTKSIIVLDKFIDEDGTCKMLKGTGSITVDVFPDGSTRVGGKGVTGPGYDLSDCPEDFAKLSK